jgi:hypothetical protein
MVGVFRWCNKKNVSEDDDKSMLVTDSPDAMAGRPKPYLSSLLPFLSRFPPGLVPAYSVLLVTGVFVAISIVFKLV